MARLHDEHRTGAALKPAERSGVRRSFEEARTAVASAVAIEGVVVAAATAGEKPRGRRKSAA